MDPRHPQNQQTSHPKPHDQPDHPTAQPTSHPDPPNPQHRQNPHSPAAPTETPRMTTTRHPQMSNTSLHNTTPRIPPSLIFNSATLYTKPFPSFLSRRGLSLVLSPHNPPTQLPSRDPGPLNLLLRPGRSTPRLPPSVISNSATLCMQPVHSFLSRRGSSLGLSPHNPPTQLPSRDPGPLNLLLRPGRSMPRLPPSVISNSATLCMQPVHSFLSRRGSSLGLSPHNPPTQLPRGIPDR